MTPDLKALTECVRVSAADDTSSRPSSATRPHWTPGNPLFGHCGVVALIVHDYYGGVILHGSIPPSWHPIVGFTGHVWNYVGGNNIDLTREQFNQTGFPYYDFVRGFWETPEVVSRDTLLEDEVLLENYKHFKGRVTQHLCYLGHQ